MTSFVGETSFNPNSLLEIGSRKPNFQLANDLVDDGNFLIPNVQDPAFFCRTNFASASGDKDKEQLVKFAKVSGMEGGWI
jgi:hypothetical protein